MSAGYSTTSTSPSSSSSPQASTSSVSEILRSRFCKKINFTSINYFFYVEVRAAAIAPWFRLCLRPQVRIPSTPSLIDLIDFLSYLLMDFEMEQKDEKEEFELILFKYSFAQIFLSKILES